MNYSFLKNTNLFHGISEDEIKYALKCLNARQKTYKKNEIIFNAGNTVNEIGLVLSGSVNVVMNLYWGDSRILGHIEKGQVFAENYAAVVGKELICDITACEDCEILFLNLRSVMTTCQRCCSFHQQLIYNLLKISAQKNLNLLGRIMHTASRSIRSRIISYLSEQSMINGSTHFKIPFDRKQLADYLGVDRSALSNELSKMQKEGLITFKKNDFVLNDL
ncbi:MAG: Crp/Fnr family transcriptional regulator [Clostridia bacterium]|nr:Crp/Fnr family transcriptional regulator [Clostridia bacterium]